MRGVLFDSGGTLVGPVGGRWNPRFDFEEVLLRHHQDVPESAFAAAFAAGDDLLRRATTTPPRADYHRAILAALGIAAPSSVDHGEIGVLPVPEARFLRDQRVGADGCAGVASIWERMDPAAASTHRERTMEYTRLGGSGLKVSRIALGCMSFGDRSRGYNEWALDDDAAEPIFRQAVELGITFWDTANVYGYGSSEEIVGRAIGRYTRREDVVLATKVFFPMHDGPGGSGLSRRAIMEQIDASLRRLGTDYVDLYQIHRFDPDTPVEETMEALHDVVKAGKARYLGASSMWAWQFAKLQYTADLGGWTRFVSMQNQYSLMQREDERELFGLLADQGVGSIPWSPLAKGRLTRPWHQRTERGDVDTLAQQRYSEEADKPIADAVERLAESRGVPMAQIALAWVLRNPVVTAPIVGPTKPHHLPDAVAALDLELTDDEVRMLEEPYTLRLPTGFA